VRPRPPNWELYCLPHRAESIRGCTDFFAQPVPVTAGLRTLDSEEVPARLTEFLRFASPCAASACAHFQEGVCELASKIVRHKPVVEALPPCAIRDSCRWNQQEGDKACLRCPGVVTDSFAEGRAESHDS
jgi:hypothetical protein